MVLRNPYQPPEDGLPPEAVRITDLRAEPWAEDGRRVRIHLQLTPFLERPNMEVIMTRDDKEVASINIIESIEDRMTFTMHIRGPEIVDGNYLLTASVSYPEIGVVDEKKIEFETQEKLE